MLPLLHRRPFDVRCSRSTLDNGTFLVMWRQSINLNWCWRTKKNDYDAFERPAVANDSRYTGS